jgi:lipoprotein NlpI
MVQRPRAEERSFTSFTHGARTLADCDRVLSIAPEHDFALLNRGVALAHLGRKVEARRSIDASVTSDPESRRRAETAIQRFGL